MEEGTVSDARNLCSERPTPSSARCRSAEVLKLHMVMYSVTVKVVPERRWMKTKWNTENKRIVKKKFDVVKKIIAFTNNAGSWVERIYKLLIETDIFQQLCRLKSQGPFLKKFFLRTWTARVVWKVCDLTKTQNIFSEIVFYFSTWSPCNSTHFAQRYFYLCNPSK